jgi:prolyl oligopeptidase PreP (S9A serine peptidase family)
MLGGKDERIDPSHAIQLAALLKENHPPFTFLLLEGGGHQHQPEQFPLWKNWIDQYVRDQEPWLKPEDGS